MNIETKIIIELEPQEKEILDQAADLLDIICCEFPTCDGCPLYYLCGKSDDTPRDALKSLIKNY